MSVNIDEISLMEAAVEDPAEDMGQSEIIQNALRLLNEEQRAVIDLRILKGYSMADTAKRMNKSEGNVRVLQYRALQKLTSLLKNEY